LIIGEAGRRHQRYRRQSAFPVVAVGRADANKRLARQAQGQAGDSPTGSSPWSAVSRPAVLRGTVTLSAPRLSVSRHFTPRRPRPRLQRCPRPSAASPSLRRTRRPGRAPPSWSARSGRPPFQARAVACIGVKEHLLPRAEGDECLPGGAASFRDLVDDGARHRLIARHRRPRGPGRSGLRRRATARRGRWWCSASCGRGAPGSPAGRGLSLS